MSIILITPEKQAEIAAAIERARANVVPWATLRNVAVADSKPTLALADRRESHWRPPSEHVVFDGGVRCAISFEEQPAGIVRHISMSTPSGEKFLHPIAVAMVAREFGIEFDPSGERDPLCGRTGRIWREEFEPGRWAINIVVLEVERAGGHA